VLAVCFEKVMKMRKLLLLSVAMIFLLLPCPLETKEIDCFCIKNVSLNRVIDGDTINVDIADFPDIIGKDISVRLSGIDAAEMNDKRKEIKEIAIEAKREIERLCTDAEIELVNVERDKYFRLLADVKCNGISINEYLLDRGLVKRYGQDW